MQSRVSIAELIDTDTPLRPDDAAAIVREVCRQFAEGGLRGIPNATVIRLTLDGTVVVEGPVSRDHSPVPAAAALLTDLLPGFDGANGFRVPGGLRLVLARALGALDVPPFSGVPEFSSSLERFASPDLPDVVRRLFQSWAARQASRPPDGLKGLTISDVRRARRATGLSLEDVSRGSSIPAAKLRELEWGYVRNWHADAAGRDELGRYARAAGLDEDLVVSVAWPLIESDAVEEPACAEPPCEDAAWALVPVGTQALIPPVPRTVTRPAPLIRYRWALALAAAILLVAAVVATGWEQQVSKPATRAAAAPSIEARRPPIGDVRPASFERPVPNAVEGPAPSALEKERPAASRPRARKAPARKAPAPRRSFFQKELLRIVIR
jgi:hypothetical protein